MRSLVARAFFVGVVLVFAAGLTAQADTLKLKDGRQIQGKYLGGSADQIQFQVNGKFEVYKTADVAAIQFSEEGVAAVTSDISMNAASNQTVTIPAGTRILVRMIDSVDSSTNRLGDVFHASLEDNLTVGNTVVAPKGADIYGRLAEAKSAGHISGKSQLNLELTGIRINGNIQPIVTGQYDVAGKSRGKQSAERIGGGAAVGAIIGAIAGGGRGAAIGAGVGAGAGTAVQVITHGDQVRVPSETLLEFRIDQPFTVTVASGGGQ
jgi:hypothetical protein